MGTRKRATLVLILASGLTALSAAQAGVIYVDAAATGAGNGSSWTDAFTGVQPALAAALPGDRLWVAKGMYKPGGAELDSFHLKSRVEVYGGFDGTETSLADRAGLFALTILSGDLAGDDGAGFANYGENSRHVVTASGTDATAVLDGFTIQGGHGRSPAYYGGVGGVGEGGGLYNIGGSPTLRNLIFRENLARGAYADAWIQRNAFGAGIYNENGNPTISLCVFTGNLARGADDSEDIGGSGAGGGIYNLGGSPLISHCAFFGNRAEGGDVCCSGDEYEWMTGGSAFGAGIYTEGGDPTISNCLFSGNRVAAGFGLFSYGVTRGAGLYAHAASVTNCTIVNNVGVGVYAAASPVLTNCIVWANSSKQIDGGSPVVDYCCVQGLSGVSGGVGNISADPSFKDADGADDVFGTEDDDLALMPGSPCIDAADNDSVLADALDLDEDGLTAEPVPLDLDLAPRFSDDPVTLDSGHGVAPIVDMGPHEFQADFCQQNLGFRGPGAVILTLCGDDLTLAGSTATASITGGAPNSTVFLIAGLTFDPTPLMGGTLVPFPPAILFSGFTTDGTGGLAFPVSGTGGPAVTVYFQAAVMNGPQPEFSNALQVVVGN